MFEYIQSHKNDSDEVKKMVKAKIEAEKEPAAKLEKLKEVTDSMLESGESFEETIDNAMNILRKKITKITMSTESANVVSENKDSPQQFLTKYQDIRTDLINGLNNMKNS